MKTIIIAIIAALALGTQGCAEQPEVDQAMQAETVAPLFVLERPQDIADKWISNGCPAKSPTCEGLATDAPTLAMEAVASSCKTFDTTGACIDGASPYGNPDTVDPLGVSCAIRHPSCYDHLLPGWGPCPGAVQMCCVLSNNDPFVDIEFCCELGLSDTGASPTNCTTNRFQT